MATSLDFVSMVKQLDKFSISDKSDVVELDTGLEKGKKRGPKKTEDLKEYHKNYKKSEKWQNYLNEYVEKNKDILNAKKREDRKIKKDVYILLKNCIFERKVKFASLETAKAIIELYNLQYQIKPEEILLA
jgi:hypothetical protein